MSARARRRVLCALILGGVLIAGLLGGCTVRREFIGNRLTVEDIVPLPSLRSKQEVLTTIGPPSEIQLLLDGSAFVYRFDVQRGSSLNLTALQASFGNTTTDRRADRLIVEFDKQGQIRRTGFAASGFPEEE